MMNKRRSGDRRGVRRGRRTASSRPHLEALEGRLCLDGGGAPGPLALVGPFTLTLDSGSDGGAAGDLVTNVNEPVFRGQADAGSTVRLFARRTDQATPEEVGLATAAADGTWAIKSAPLQDGVYTISATETDQAGQVATAQVPGTLTIDTQGPRVIGLEANPFAGPIRIAFEDSGTPINSEGLLHPATYQLRFLDASRGPSPVVAGVLAETGGSPQRRGVLLVLNNGQPLRHGRFVLTIEADGITDSAGNALEGTFRGRLPSDGRPGTDFRAEIDTNGFIASAQPLTRQIRGRRGPRTPLGPAAFRGLIPSSRRP